MNGFMRRLELKVPPMAVLLLAVLVMWLVSLGDPRGMLPPVARFAIAAILVTAGVGIIAAAITRFRRAQTTVDPRTPDAATTLVCTGVYRFTRNPMYLGFLLLLLGWAAYLSSLRALIVVPLFMLYLDRFQVAPEERALAARFGERFHAYVRDVRRWF